MYVLCTQKRQNLKNLNFKVKNIVLQITISKGNLLISIQHKCIILCSVLRFC